MKITENSTNIAMGLFADFEKSNYTKNGILKKALDHLSEALEKQGKEQERAQNILRCNLKKLMRDGEQALQTESDGQCRYITLSLKEILDFLDEDFIAKNVVGYSAEEIKTLKNSLAFKWFQVQKSYNNFQKRIPAIKEFLALSGVSYSEIEKIFSDVHTLPYENT